MVVKNWTKKTFESSIHASQKLLYSLRFSIYMKMVNSTWFYGSGETTFAHKFFISTTFATQSFDLKLSNYPYTMYYQTTLIQSAITLPLYKVLSHYPHTKYYHTILSHSTITLSSYTIRTLYPNIWYLFRLLGIYLGPKAPSRALRAPQQKHEGGRLYVT